MKRVIKKVNRKPVKKASTKVPVVKLNIDTDRVVGLRKGYESMLKEYMNIMDSKYAGILMKHGLCVGDKVICEVPIGKRWMESVCQLQVVWISPVTMYSEPKIKVFPYKKDGTPGNRGFNIGEDRLGSLRKYQ